MFNKTLINRVLMVMASILSFAAVSCNSSENDDLEYTYFYYSSTAVTGFSLEANSKILTGLDSVYFSIDLENATIFNAVPLPQGTDIRRLIVNITTDNCSEVELRFTTRFGNDTTINYLTNATDSINFANGPVTLHVVSYDTEANRDYKISVNVYEHNPDSLEWDTSIRTALPTELENVTSQKTASNGTAFYVLTYDSESGGYSMAYSTDVFNDDWTITTPGFDELVPNPETLTLSADGTLYILDSSSQLYSSVDGGASWFSCGAEMINILGTYGNSVLGVTVNGGVPYSVKYPDAMTPVELPAEFPVTGSSVLNELTTSWNVSPLSVMIGGRSAQGQLQGSTWGYDGNTWAKISVKEVEPAEGRALFKYFISNTDSTSWRVTTMPVLVTTCGRPDEGGIINAMKYSTDMGVHWTDCPIDMAWPAGLSARYNAQIYTVDAMLTANSRAIKPITEWECPYIFLFGGINSQGVLNRNVWKGVTLRYTYKPIE